MNIPQTRRLAALRTLAISILACMGIQAMAQTTDSKAPVAPASLPGNGLKRFDFFYAGEAKSRNMYIIKGGQIAWSYIDTTGRGEISDAILMRNGDILFAHQYGVTLINKDKKVLWKYDAPEGFETHTAQPVGKDHVVLVQNGKPAKVFAYNIKMSKAVK